MLHISDSNSTSKDPVSLPSLNLGNTLVEIGGLSALVGSSVAESLTFGSRGPAGIAWAATSSFGTVSVIKACISGAGSGWLRETLGIRSKLSDLAVGMDLKLDSHRALRVRHNLGDPLAIYSHVVGDAPLVKGHNIRKLKANTTWDDVYAFDYSTSMMLRGIPDTAVGDHLQVYSYARYPFFRRHNARFQLSALFLSAGKLAEIYYLWIQGGLLLGLISATPWVYFFITAICMEIRELVLHRMPEPEYGSLDIIAGQLPMVSRPGGARKLVLGAARNPQKTFLWQLIWIIGALICTTSMLLSYFILGQQTKSTAFVWAGFQLIWLGMRILVYHVADPPVPTSHRMLVAQPLATLPTHMKQRVTDLTFALAKRQIYAHPRGRHAYDDDDLSSSSMLKVLLDDIVSPTHYPLPDIYLPSVRVNIKAVFGDTLLSSAVWMTGTHITPMELYDSCIVVFSLASCNIPNAPTKTIAIPAARVLSDGRSVPAVRVDLEGTAPLFIPKGASNKGYDLTWWYWVPCGSGLWLQMKSDDLTILGQHQVDVMDDTQVSALLRAGNMNISLTGIDDVKRTVDLSRKARQSLLDLLN